ncbi:unnamed protein product [Cochlearia groenlandica]
MSKKTSSSMPSASQNRSVTEEDNDSYSSSSWSENDEDDETVEVKGFNVFQSQENKVKEIFKKHQDLTSNFNVKNQHLKDTYMEVLLDLIKTLCKSTKDISMEDLNKARNTLYDLTRAGFKVNWLRQKLEEAYLKREKQRVSEDTITELKEHVKKQKLSLSDFETYLKEEKAAALAAEARFGFNDVV